MPLTDSELNAIRSIVEEVYTRQRNDLVRIQEWADRAGALEAQLQRVTADLRAAQELADVLENSNIIEIAVRNKTRSVSDYMNHWEGRALKAEAELERLQAATPEPAA